MVDEFGLVGISWSPHVMSSLEVGVRAQRRHEPQLVIGDSPEIRVLVYHW